MQSPARDRAPAAQRCDARSLGERSVAVPSALIAVPFADADAHSDWRRLAAGGGVRERGLRGSPASGRRRARRLRPATNAAVATELPKYCVGGSAPAQHHALRPPLCLSRGRSSRRPAGRAAVAHEELRKRDLARSAPHFTAVATLPPEREIAALSLLEALAFGTGLSATSWAATAPRAKQASQVGLCRSRDGVLVPTQASVMERRR
jgi:hypothetical protein